MSDSEAPWTVANQAPLSVGFPRQESWHGLPFSSPGDIPDQGTEPGSPALQADSLPTEPPEKPVKYINIGYTKFPEECVRESNIMHGDIKGSWAEWGPSFPPGVTPDGIKNIAFFSG